MTQDNRISLTPTVAKQTQKAEFGDVLRNTMHVAGRMGSTVLGAIPAGGVISTAVSQVSALTTNSSVAIQSSPGIVTLPQQKAATSAGGATDHAMASSMTNASPEFVGMIEQMRAEADRSTEMQMRMQQESREYNTVSNVLKVRHESAKSAINNIR